MAFETGTSLHPQDLLSKIVSHATAAGWVGPGGVGLIRTTGYRDGIGGDPEDQVTMSDPSAAQTPHFHFLYDNTPESASIAGAPSASDGGASTDYWLHPGSPATGTTRAIRMGQSASCLTNQGFGGAHQAYFIFSGSTSDGRYMHVVCEGDSGVYFHLMWGTIEKAGTFNGGAYMTAFQADDSNQVNVPFNMNPGGWHSSQWIRNDDLLTGGTATTDGGTSRWQENLGTAYSSSYLAYAWMAGGVISWNQRTPFAPNMCLSWEDLIPTPGTDAFVILGHTPDLRLVSLDGREPGEIVTIGSDDWYLFPVHTKTVETGSNAYNTTATGGTPAATSNLAGLAYLKVP